MEHLDSISMALLDCVLRQAEKDLPRADTPADQESASDSKAQRKSDALLRKMAAGQATSMIDTQRRRQGPGPAGRISLKRLQFRRRDTHR